MIRTGFWHASLFVVLVLSACSGSLFSQDQTRSPLSQRELIVHVLNRITFGATDELVAEVEKVGIKEWVEEQFAHDEVDPYLSTRLATMPTLGLTTQDLYKKFSNGSKARQIKSDLNGSIILRAALNKWQASEVMTEFWRNHLNVDRAKDSVRYTATDYEQNVLRRFVFSDFHSLLSASAKHPAMLVYLDNYISRKPPTKTELKIVARRVRQKTGSKERGAEAANIAAQRGLNENYARELMELHTLGVDNGYTQKDVVALARALTGWTVDRDKQKYEFLYREEMHAGGDKHVLGRTIPREKRRNGIVEGEKIIARLAAHKNTADYLAKKLCIYLVSDTPSPALLKKVARILRRSKFNLRTSVKDIILSSEFREPKNFRSKFKTPFEFVISSLRAVDAEISSTKAISDWIEEMGQPIYGCEDPTGYSDTAESWRDPGVMAYRWKFALDLVGGKIKGVRVPSSFYDDVKDQAMPKMIKRLGEKVIPGGLRPQTISTLLRVAGKQKRDIAEQDREILDAQLSGEKPPKAIKYRPIHEKLLAVLLGAPEFQQQ